MMLIERDHDALAAETGYRLERDRQSYADRDRRRRSTLRAAASRLWVLHRRSDGEVARPGGSASTATAVSHHVAAH